MASARSFGSFPLVLTLLGMFSAGSMGAVKTWDGGAGTLSWHIANNWNPDGIPGISDDVIIDVPTSTITVTYSTGTTTINSLVCNENLTLSGGTLNINAASQISGVFTLQGTLGGSADLTIAGTFNFFGNAATMGGTGKTTIQAGATMHILTGSTGATLARRLENNGAALWDGGVSPMNPNCRLNFNGGNVTNNGTFNCGVPVQFSQTMQGTGGTNAFVNNGTFTSGGNLSIGFAGGVNGIPFTNAGTVQVLPNNLGFGTYTQSAGATLLAGNGSSIDTSNGFSLQGGTLGGVGDINGVNQTGGSIAPGNSPGLLEIANLTQNASSTLDIELGGLPMSQFDRLGLSVTATLAGTLRLTFINGFVPHHGDSFTILTAPATHSGTFSTVDVIGYPDCVANVSHTATSAIVTIESTPPTALCRNINVSLNSLGQASITAAQIDNGSSDNCEFATRQVAPSSFTCADVGANPVTLTITDVAGNQATCNATVTVRSVAQYQGPSGGSWFNFSFWGGGGWCGGLPNQNSSISLGTTVHVDEAGALANNVNVQSGGQLSVGGFFGLQGGDATLDVSEDIAVDSGGSLNLTDNGTVTAASVVIHSGGTLQLNSPSALLAVGDLTIEPGATLDWTAGAIKIDGGTWTNPASTTLTVGCTTGQWAALELANDGTILADQINVCADGEARGNGTLSANLSNGGTVRPGTSAGTLSVDGECVEQPSGTLDVEIGGLSAGAQHDVIAVTDGFTADGLLRATLINAFTPVMGNQFTIVTAASASERFDTYDLPALGGGNVWRVLVDGTTVVMRVQKPGDVNLNGVVNIQDLLSVIAAWGACPPGCAGDMFPMPGGDGVTNIQDLLFVIANWG